ncbi:MAG: hypothetical protein LBL65_00580 [Campylobacteraceae bacterium]|nr:hypothetical protein [Campylobacteraceae bacterium]
MLGKYDNLPSGHEILFNQAYGISNWYFANSSLSVTSYTLTDKSVNFYAVPNVIEVTSQDDLAAISTDLAGNYILLNDIVLNENEAGFDSDGWIPIGSYPNVFTGVFNGNRYKITNLWINRPLNTYVGLFGYTTYKAKISNLGVEIAEGKSVRGDNRVGGIVGYLEDSFITNVYSLGNINGITHVGGIVGGTECVSIINAYSIGNINGSGEVGGIAGQAAVYSNITNTYSIGNISGNKYIGGIAGYIDYGSNISNNIAINSLVNGSNYTSRVVGYIGTSSVNSVVSNNFALDNMTGGVNYDGATNSFSNSGNISYHGTDKTEAELKIQETYSDAIEGDGLGGLGWQFGDNNTAPWKIESNKNNGYPYFYWQEL